MNQQEQMYRLVGQWRESGLPKTKFCREQQLSLHQFNYWIKKQTRESVSEPSIREVNFLSLSQDQSPEKSIFSKAVQKQILCVELPNGTKITFY
jgi:hypothetical protein